MLALAAGSRYLKSLDLLFQSAVFGLLAIIRLYVVNIEWSSAPASRPLILVIGALALLFYATAFALRELQDASRIMRQAHEWVGSTLVAVLLWYQLPHTWLATGWMALALLLCLAWQKLGLDELWWQGNLMAAIAFIRVLAFDLLDAKPQYHGLHLRIITALICAAILYALANITRRDNALWKNHAELHSWAGSVLLTTLMWTELQPLNVALAWAVFGVAFFEMGLLRKIPSLRWQGSVALAASFTRIFFVNLNAISEPGTLSPRIYSIVPLVLIYFYLYYRAETKGRELLSPSLRTVVPAVFSYFGVVAIAMLIRFEVTPTQWVAVGWSGLALVLLAVAYASRREVFLHQAVILSGVVLFRATLFDFFGGSYFEAQTRMPASIAIGILFASLAIAYPLRRQLAAAKPPENGFSRMVAFIARRPDQVFFFVPLFLLTVLLALETSKGAITIAWGIESVAVFVFGMVIRERNYIFTAIGLILLCLGKLVFVDLWQLSSGQKYLTMGSLGIAAILFSFLIPRYGHRWKELL
jgi:hypothetical protein